MNIRGEFSPMSVLNGGLTGSAKWGEDFIERLTQRCR